MATYAAKLRSTAIDGTTVRLNSDGTLSSNVPMEPRGNVYYVDSVNGSAQNDALSWAKAVTTIDTAIGKCTANQGDVIYVSQFHQEVRAVTGDIITVDVAGISIIGVSNGARSGVVTTGVATLHNMPTIILDHAGATITVSAANCKISGLYIASDIADVAVGITIAAAGDGTIVEGCVFNDNGAAVEILTGISVATTVLYAQILNNTFYTTVAGGSTQAILLVGTTTGTVIRGNFAFGKYSSNCILGSADTHTSIFIADNILGNGEVAAAVTLKTDCTGIASRNLLGGIGSSTLAAVFVGTDAMLCFENYCSDVANVSGVLHPLAATAD